MAHGYLTILTYWPLLIAAIITLLAIKSFFFARKNAGQGFDIISTELMSNMISEILPDKIDEKSALWLEKARETNELIDIMSEMTGNSSRKCYPNENEINLQLNKWQKIYFSWSIIWTGITCFVTIEMLLDPILWSQNWVLLPYFFYYIGFGIIYFLKR
ncbi:MAG: hypothetical protein ACTSRG_17775 [Candidatus Helarchaeota archaeon]